MLHPRLHVCASLISLPAAALALAAASSVGHSSVCAPRGAAVTYSAVTFSKDVAPIFFKNCAGCHRPGEVAPMSLLTYKDARPWARSIKERVLNRTMPPWHADRAYGKFANDRSLSERDIDTIVEWVDQGALEGDRNLLPPAPRFPEGWKIGKPDVVLTMPVKFDVPAHGVLDYKYFEVPTHLKEDRWIQAAEVRAGNPAVVHHVIIFVEHPRARTGETQAAGSGDGLEALTGVAPGEEPVILPDEVGMLLRAGSVLLFEVHYTPNGVAQGDQTSVALVFSKKPVLKESMGEAAMNTDFAIPPGDPNYEVRSSYKVDDDCHITSLMPHMHVRGKDFQYKLIYPNGASLVILSVPRYNFNWQTRYIFAEPIAAPKGSRIDCIAHFDNSSGNKANPDPARLVRWGPQTWDEMMIGFIEFTLDHQRLDLPQPQATQQGSSTPGAQQTPPFKANETDPAHDLPAIDVILDKYVQSLGGKQSIQAKVSRIMKGAITAPSVGADGTIEIYAKAPNKELTQIRSTVLGNSRTGFDGAVAWVEENGEIEDLTVYRRREADFYLPIKLRELFPRIELKGKEKIGGRDAYVLEAPRGGNPKRWYFDAQTGLLVCTEARDSDGKLLRREDYSDYRAIDGIQIPLTIRYVGQDQIEIIMKFTEVRHNAPIDDAKFDKPAAKSTAANRPARVLGRKRG
jgi:mono/diheme cytochrome c family protein